jgi:hypothetical protein
MYRVRSTHSCHNHMRCAEQIKEEKKKQKLYLEKRSKDLEVRRHAQVRSGQLTAAPPQKQKKRKMTSTQGTVTMRDADEGEDVNEADDLMLHVAIARSSFSHRPTQASRNPGVGGHEAEGIDRRCVEGVCVSAPRLWPRDEDRLGSRSAPDSWTKRMGTQSRASWIRITTNMARTRALRSCAGISRSIRESFPRSAIAGDSRRG